jgi:hypothetical protein
MNAQFFFITGTFGIFLIIYSFVLYLLSSRLHRFFPSFYAKEKTKIFLVSFSIILSIIVRMAVSIVYSIKAINDDFD